jgi:methylmalonyl-CoA mutase N-terminal domain/subunit
VPDVPDPLGGSYFIESLTAEMEKGAREYIRRIDQMGGMIPAIERGFPQTEIANASYEYQHSIETGEQKIVGVNAFAEHSEEPLEVLEIDASAQAHQLEKLARLKSKRDNEVVQKCLDALRDAALGSQNTMPYILDAVRAYATVGEICDVFREAFGVYTETSVL